MAVSADEIQMALGGLHLEVEETLTNFWRSLDLMNPAKARDELLEFMPMLLEQYGSKAASIAADWYDELRMEERIVDAFFSELAEIMPREFVQQRTRFGAGHLWTEAQDDTLLFLRGAITGWVSQAFNETLELNSINDLTSLGWARKPEPGACKFCLMLASRPVGVHGGGPYASMNVATTVAGRGIERQIRTDSLGRSQWRGGGVKARGNQGLEDKYHDHCRCVAIPYWESTNFQEQHGFDPNELYRRYQAGEFESAAERERNRPWREREALLNAN